MNFELMAETLPQLLGAIDDTLLLAFSSVFLGFFVAVPVAMMRLSNSKILWSFAYSFVYLIRSTPLLVQMFLIYYGSGQFREALEFVGLWVFFREPWFCAILALTINTGAYASEIIRGGIQSVPLGQIEAGKAIGMSRVTLFRRIIFPVAIRQALPAYGNEIMLIIKSTSLASTITIIEVTGLARKIASLTYQPVEVFIMAGCIYLTINFIVSRTILSLEYALSKHTRDRTSKQPRLKDAIAR